MRDIVLTVKQGSVYTVTGYQADCICGWVSDIAESQDEAFDTLQEHHAANHRPPRN